VDFHVQFVRFRRGEPEVIRTLHIEATDGAAALARVTCGIGMGTWPMNTAALRVMDDGGRTVLDWMVPSSSHEPLPSLPQAPDLPSIISPALLSDNSTPENLPESARSESGGQHLLDVGQAISYAEDGKPEHWQGGYQIVNAVAADAREPRYTIRNADDPNDRVVKQHELREDLGARTRGH
jgi:hypothetical protein